MWQFQGFSTEEEAKRFGKGKVISAHSPAKSDRGDYTFLVVTQGLDSEKYPYAVQWRVK